jgi:hypothetical protein
MNFYKKMYFVLLGVPYQTLPYMEVDGVWVGQSLAIARFFAKQAGIAGKTAIEQALADGIVDFTKDLIQSKKLKLRD